jgi:hypothetical protein
MEEVNRTAANYAVNHSSTGRLDSTAAKLQFIHQLFIDVEM